MEIGIVGLGRMGGNIARRLMQAGHRAVVWDKDASAVAALVAEGAVGVTDLAGLVAALTPPRAVWVMLPHGAPTEDALEQLGGLLSPGDTAIDGGNTHWKDDIRRAKALGSRLDAPFMTLSFLALLVIPDLKLSDRGLFDGLRFRFTPAVTC